jgi:CMP/dCMP kinase
VIRDWTNDIGSVDAGHWASVVGQYEIIRTKLKAEQTRIADGGRIICEGRDQGTSVFPTAPLKFFVTASPAERARRMAESTGETDLAMLEAKIIERDHRDSTRALDPLRPATDAMIIDTTTMPVVAVAALMKEAWDRCPSNSKA